MQWKLNFFDNFILTAYSDVLTNQLMNFKLSTVVRTILSINK